MMISYQDALALIADEASPQAVEPVARDAALGRVAAAAITSSLDIPSFDNSAMDGFALCAEHTAGVSADAPRRFTVDHCLAAGDVLEVADQSFAVEIMTGAKMPAGFNAVVPIENVELVRDAQGHTLEITVRSPLRASENVRYAGEDFKSGQLIAAAGTRLHAGHIAMMAAAGVAQVPVFQMPAVAVFTTGKEVTDDDRAPLRDGEIYNSNTPYLLAQLKDAGIPAAYAGNIGDDEQAFVKTLERTRDARIVISSGAVSKGKWDFIPELLRQQGARIVFHRVGIKPGKPVLFARLDDGRYYFGLPGNPVSTAVGLRFFVQPLIRQLLGMAAEPPQFGVLDHRYQKKGGLRNFLKASIRGGSDGRMRLSILDGQESFKLSPFLQMNSWAVIDESQNALDEGSVLAVVPFELFPFGH